MAANLIVAPLPGSGRVEATLQIRDLKRRLYCRLLAISVPGSCDELHAVAVVCCRHPSGREPCTMTNAGPSTTHTRVLAASSDLQTCRRASFLSVRTRETLRMHGATEWNVPADRRCDCFLLRFLP